MHRLSRALFAIAGALLPTGAPAAAQAPQQASAYFGALAVPPTAVGTCMSAPGAGPEADSGDLRGFHLVMASRATGGRREMTVYTDRAGRIRRYSEIVHRMAGATTSKGENVTAVVAPDGRVSGMITRTTVVMKAPASTRVDSAALRAMRESATTSQASEQLGAEEQAKVRVAAAWLVRRCPD